MRPCYLQPVRLGSLRLAVPAMVLRRNATRRQAAWEPEVQERQPIWSTSEPRGSICAPAAKDAGQEKHSHSPDKTLRVMYSCRLVLTHASQYAAAAHCNTPSLRPCPAPRKHGMPPRSPGVHGVHPRASARPPMLPMLTAASLGRGSQQTHPCAVLRLHPSLDTRPCFSSPSRHPRVKS